MGTGPLVAFPERVLPVLLRAVRSGEPPIKAAALSACMARLAGLVLLLEKERGDSSIFDMSSKL